MTQTDAHLAPVAVAAVLLAVAAGGPALAADDHKIISAQEIKSMPTRTR